MIGVLVLMLGSLVISLFTHSAGPLRDGGPLAIVFSLVVIVIAALSFLVDFDSADQLIRAGAPEKAAWGIALGLTVTLVWLYPGDPAPAELLLLQRPLEPLAREGPLRRGFFVCRVCIWCAESAHRSVSVHNRRSVRRLDRTEPTRVGSWPNFMDPLSVAKRSQPVCSASISCGSAIGLFIPVSTCRRRRS